MDQSQALQIKQQVVNMKAMGAPEEDRAAFITKSGITPEEWKNAPEVKPQPGAGVDASVDPLQAGKALVSPLFPLGMPGEPLKAYPDRARAYGAAISAPFTGGLGSSLISGMFGQAAELVNKYVLGNPDQDEKTPLQRGAGEALNIATQLPFAYRPKGYTPELEQYLKTAPPSQRASFGEPTLAQDFKNQGVPTTGVQGEVNQSKFQMGVEQGLSNLPSSTPTMQANAQRRMGAFADAAEKNIQALGEPRTPEMVGSILVKGYDDFKAQGNQAFKQQFGQVRGLDNLNVDIVPVKDRAASLLKEFQQGLKSGSSAATNVLEDVLARPDTIDFGTARTLRSDLARISRNVGDEVVKGKAQSAGALLAGDIHNAMDQAAKLGLESSSFKKYMEVNAGYKDFISTLDSLSPLANVEHPERAYDLFNTIAKKYPSQIRDVKELRNVIPPKDWNAVVATHLDDMLRDAQGEISPAKFATRWNNARYQDTKDLLVGQSGELRKSWDEFARVAGALKSTESMVNTSRTAPVGFMMKFLSGAPLSAGMAAGGMATGGVPGALAGAATGAAIQLGTPWVVAKAWTNPKIADWMTAGLKISPSGTLRGELSNASRHVMRLMAIPEMVPYRQAIQNRWEDYSAGEHSDSIQTNPMTKEPSDTLANFNGVWDHMRTGMRQIKQADGEAAAMMNKSYRPVIETWPTFKQARSQLEALDAQREQIISNPSLNPKERRDNIAILNSRMNRTAQSALSELDRRAKQGE